MIERAAIVMWVLAGLCGVGFILAFVWFMRAKYVWQENYYVSVGRGAVILLLIFATAAWVLGGAGTP